MLPQFLDRFPALLQLAILMLVWPPIFYRRLVVLLQFAQQHDMAFYETSCARSTNITEVRL